MRWEDQLASYHRGFGLGYSDRPKLDYVADVMENFLVDLVSAPDSPVNSSVKDLVVFGGGHAATILARAAMKDLVKPKAIAAVAPTWAVPLPIVFGRDSAMESRLDYVQHVRQQRKGNPVAIKIPRLPKPEKCDPRDCRQQICTDEASRRLLCAGRFPDGPPRPDEVAFLDLFAGLEGKMPVLVVSTKNSPKRS